MPNAARFVKQPPYGHLTVHTPSRAQIALSQLEFGDGVQEHDLVAACATIGTLAGHGRPAELAIAIDAVRRIAQAQGRLPVVAVARAIEAALARGERGVALAGWIAMLGEAAGSDRSDADCTNTYLAAGAVRLAY